MMTTQSIYDQLLHLRWSHCYQWKNLLDQEREARRQLEQQHQEQIDLLPVAEKRTKAGALLHKHLVSLRLLQQTQQQKRSQLKAAQAHQMQLIQEQLVSLGKVNRCIEFEHLSALRRP